MKRLTPWVLLFLVTACGSGPLTMVRPASVDAGGFDCVGPTLHRLGYTITAGDRSIGFVRARRDRGGRSFLTGDKGYDVLLVNYLRGETEDDPADDRIQVTASLVIDRRPGALTALALASSDPGPVVVYGGQDEVGPTDDGVADAEQLLRRCGSAPT